MTHKILRLPEVINRTGLSRSSIYSYIGRNLFPRPIGLGIRSVGWHSSDIESWIESRQLRSDSHTISNT